MSTVFWPWVDNLTWSWSYGIFIISFIALDQLQVGCTQHSRDSEPERAWSCLKILKASQLGSKDVGACFGRFSFVFNFKLLVGSFFGARSATGPDDQTHFRIQYEHYDEVDAWYTHEMDENIIFNGKRVDANNVHPTHRLPTAVHTYTGLVLMENGCKLGLREQWTPRELTLSKSINYMMPH